MFEEKKPEGQLPPEEEATNEPVDMFAGSNAPQREADPSADQMSQEPGQEEVMEDYEDTVPHSGKRHMILALIAIVALILVIGGGVGLIFILKPKQEVAPTPQILSQPTSQEGIPSFSDQPQEEQATQPAEEQQASDSNNDSQASQDELLPQGETNTTVPKQDAISTATDTDGDGLSDEKEIQFRTNANLFDSDGDGLSDREELEVYGTDPLNADSDKDGFLDGEETKNGYDPNGSGKLPNQLPQ